MKKYLSFLMITALCAISCVSTKVSSENNYDYSVLKNNSKYIIKTKDGKEIRQFKFLSHTEGVVTGQHENTEVQIEKSNIDKILKPSAGKTVPLIIGMVGAAVALPAYIGNKPVGQ